LPYEIFGVFFKYVIDLVEEGVYLIRKPDLLRDFVHQIVP